MGAPGTSSGPVATPPSRRQGRFFYGGQAVPEGVMMRGRREFAVAVRAPDGTIRLREGALTAGLYRDRFWRLPFVRGLALLGEQLHLGMRCLFWAAQVATGQEERELTRAKIAIAVAFGAGVSVLLFLGLPLLGAGLAGQHAGSFGFVVLEGLLRVALVLGYLLLMGRLRDVRRLFQYHGAEHKAINALEAGRPLEPAAARAASRLHPRCGTGFLLVVLVISLVLFSFVALAHPGWAGTVVSRIVGIPIVAGISYECIRLLASHAQHPIARVLLRPVLWTQLLTTREPDDSMLEVAIRALRAVMAADQEPLPAAVTPTAVGRAEPA